MRELDFRGRRAQMVDLQLARRGIRSEAVLEAMRAVPREAFVPAGLAPFAYDDSPLPIGEGQTISQPYIVAMMTEALELRGGEHVLEIGTGSGYAAAVLAQLAREVVSLERFASLAAEASARLESAGVANARVLHADGLAPPNGLGAFDRIILHVALRETPGRLIERLAPGGVLFYGRTALGKTRSIRVERAGDGEAFRETDLGPCRLPLAASGLAARL
jgi:protein-L-isoaspartate(D-aspartate) O-methyltransferase